MGFSIIVFDFDGKYLRTMKNPMANERDGQKPSYMGCDNQGNILFTFDNVSCDMKYKYVVANNELEILAKCPNYDKYYLKERLLNVMMIALYPIYEYKSYSYFPNKYNDTVFRINADYSSSPAWIIQIPNKRTLEDDLKLSAELIYYSSLNGKRTFEGIRECNQYVYVYIYHYLIN